MNKLLRWGLWVVTPLVAGLVAWGAWRGVAQAQRSHDELQVLQARREQLLRFNQELRREVVSLRNERPARERAARQTLDVVAPGEVLVIAPDAIPAGPAGGASADHRL
ncbi:MAG TPA: septum formation initiator family protein [Thermoanaerobaculaceae bacterium]|nr:septum formation initiator family protein [Thermoanaerobaculaceae bacterium]HPS79639.1 septum formation initiator family protein [Thermoanaerobaculaceae bacterium]